VEWRSRARDGVQGAKPLDVTGKIFEPIAGHDQSATTAAPGVKGDCERRSATFKE